MKCKLLLFTAFIFASFASLAQQNKTYAITGDGNKDFIWMNIRQVDLNTGTVIKTIFERSKTNYSLTDAVSKKIISQSSNPAAKINVFTDPGYPTSTLVAAAAFDKRTNKLFFMPMRTAELRWVDLDQTDAALKFYSIPNPTMQIAANPRDEAGHITRMVIAADGMGYAVSNDGTHLWQFTTGKNPVINDLGTLIDAESNKSVSIHNKCTSWGGDMVADAFGKLYIISASRHVFVVDINRRIATHKGMIAGMPANFTANAAAVDDEGNLVISSANVFAGYYRVNPTDLTAVLIEGSDTKFNASDLANGNLLLQEQADAARNSGIASLHAFQLPGSEGRIFPNPVTTGNFTLNLEGYAAGTYHVLLTDVTGKNIQSNQINFTKGMRTQNIPLLTKPAKGLYLVQVIDHTKKIVLTEKLMIH